MLCDRKGPQRESISGHSEVRTGRRGTIETAHVEGKELHLRWLRGQALGHEVPGRGPHT